MVSSSASPEHVDEYLRSQQGLVTRAQALRCGITERQLYRRIDNGQWIILQRGVYRLAGVAPARQQLILAACLAGGAQTLASHRSAAWLWDLIAPGATVVEVTMPHDRRRTLRGVVIHRSRHAEPAVWRKGVPVTSPVGTLIDLAEVVRADTLGRALDQAQRKGLATGTDLLTAINENESQGCAGIALLRAVLAERGYPGVKASVLERRTLAVLRAAGLPDPIREFETGPRRAYRVDFTWPPTRLLIEVDGFDTHGTPEALQADLARQNELVSAGWIPLRYTWRDITQTPVRVTKQVGKMLAQSQSWPNWGK